MTKRYLSVCSGMEAATVAWHLLNWISVAFCEIEKAPSAVLAHHYPAVPNWGDITKFQEWPNADVDVLVGGTPCQSFSVAGLRRGLTDPRGNLMLTYLAILDKYRPTWMVWENVPGVLSSNKGRDFGSFLGALGELGYGWAYRSLDAQYFHLAQRRERVFVVGCLRGWERAAQVLLEPEGMSGYPPPSREKRQDASAPLARSVAIRGRDGTPQIELGDECANALLTPNGGRGGIGVGAVVAPLDASYGRLQGCSGQDANHGHSHLVAFGGNNTAGPIDVAAAVNACATASGRMDFESETFVTCPLTGNPYADNESRESLLIALRADGFDASEDGTGRGTPLVPVIAPCLTQNYGKNPDNSDTNAGRMLLPVSFDTTQITSRTNRSIPQAGDPCHPIAAKGHPPSVAFRTAGDGCAYEEGDTTAPLTTATDPSANVVATQWAVRRLTPTECERLQGFPDNYSLVPFRGKPMADGPRYKMLGNSMAVPVMRWIGERIQAMDVPT